MEMTCEFGVNEYNSEKMREVAYVGGNVGRDITTLGLNDGEGSEGASTELVVHLRSTLEETRVEVEHITRVSLATRRTTKEKRHLTVGNSLLGQIIIDNQS